MSGFDMLWAMRPGNIFRTNYEEVDVINIIHTDMLELVVPPRSLVMSLGDGAFVLMETDEIFVVDNLDALILAMQSEELFRCC